MPFENDFSIRGLHLDGFRPQALRSPSTGQVPMGTRTMMARDMAGRVFSDAGSLAALPGLQREGVSLTEAQKAFWGFFNPDWVHPKDNNEGGFIPPPNNPLPLPPGPGPPIDQPAAALPPLPNAQQDRGKSGGAGASGPTFDFSIKGQPFGQGVGRELGSFLQGGGMQRDTGPNSGYTRPQGMGPGPSGGNPMGGLLRQLLMGRLGLR